MPAYQGSNQQVNRNVTEFLRLAALDEEDLRVISACIQDAVVRVADIDFPAAPGRLLIVVNRFAWEKEAAGSKDRPERRRSVLQFDRVRSVARNGIDPARPDTVLSLLAITFHPDDTPSGTIELHFSGGPGLRLEVECIEARLTDLGSAWETEHRPVHPE